MNQQLLYHVPTCEVFAVDVSVGASILVLAVVNSAQVDEALFGHNGVVSGDVLFYLYLPAFY